MKIAYDEEVDGVYVQLSVGQPARKPAELRDKFRELARMGAVQGR